jgi:ribosomal protein L1
MAARGKKYRESDQKIDKLKRYTFEEAIQLSVDCAYAKFNESLDLAIKLGVDPRHADPDYRFISTKVGGATVKVGECCQSTVLG